MSLLQFPERNAEFLHIYAEEKFNVAFGLEAEGKVDEAIKTYEEIIRIDPHYHKALINLGNIYYNKQDYVLAARYYEDALKACPSNPLAMFNLANVYWRSSNFSLAEELYINSIRADGSYSSPYYNLGMMLFEIKRPMEGAKYLKKFLELEGTGQFAEGAKNVLKGLRLELTVTNR